MGAQKENSTKDMIEPPVQEEMSEELRAKVNMFLRGDAADLEVLQDKKLKSQLSARENVYDQSAKTAAKAEKWLMPSEGGYLETEGIEKSWRIKQEAITREVGISSAKNQYDIILPDLGPYTMDITPSGRYMAAAGRKGHLVLIDMKDLNLIREIQVRETTRDIVFLHNETYFAAAQKKYTYIYNQDGAELHCLKEHGSVLRLQFLKNNLLLASINEIGQLHYQDVSIGRMVANYRTGVGNSTTMQVNPYNAVVSLGHSNGTVSMWKPTSSTPMVKMLCHKAPISDIAFHQNGFLMATSGKDRKIKIWDLRKYEVVQTFPGMANSLDFSQKGLLACGYGSSVQVVGNFTDPTKYSRYMNHSMVKGYQTNKILFRPYEDALVIGHSSGWSSILIPGSGEPNFDSWVANPFETSKQKKEKEVKSVYDKLQPETIMLDPSKIGTVESRKRKEKKTKKEKEEEKEAAIAAVKNAEVKKKTKGRNKPSRKAKKRQDAIAMAKRPFMEDKDTATAKSKKQRISDKVELPTALQRFERKK